MNSKERVALSREIIRTILSAQTPAKGPRTTRKMIEGLPTVQTVIDRGRSEGNEFPREHVVEMMRVMHIGVNNPVALGSMQLPETIASSVQKAVERIRSGKGAYGSIMAAARAKPSMDQPLTTERERAWNKLKKFFENPQGKENKETAQLVRRILRGEKIPSRNEAMRELLQRLTVQKIAQHRLNIRQRDQEWAMEMQRAINTMVSKHELTMEIGRIKAKRPPRYLRKPRKMRPN